MDNFSSEVESDRYIIESVGKFFCCKNTLMLAAHLLIKQTFILNTCHLLGLGMFVHIAFSIFWINVHMPGSGML